LTQFNQTGAYTHCHWGIVIEMVRFSKQEKYDRQLRLWANNGQSSLESASILIIEPTITTLELLKNLVLPGIGKFTIVDLKDKIIDDIDLSNNFYLGDDDLGKPRADVLAANLKELNTDVQSSIIKVDSIDQYLATQDDESWASYDLVVMSWQIPHVVDRLYQLNVPLLVINSIGFYGFMRIFKPTFEIYETHPQSLIDLRLLSPWDELIQYADSIDLHNLTVDKHSTIPYLIIQLKALQHWSKTHNGEIPQSSQDKKNFKELIRSWKKDYQQLNFDEAIDNSHKIFNKIKIPSNVQDIFDKVDDYFDDDNKRTQFWILCKALKLFVLKNNGFLPISGELPDMDSSTENYITLQNIYKAKFQKDLTLFTQELLNLQATLQSSLPIPDEIISSFVKNSKHLYFSQNSARLITHNFNQLVEDPAATSSLVLLSYLVYEKYYLQTKQYPTLSDLNELIKLSMDFTTTDDDKFHQILHELVRSEGMELNNVASFMGGIGAQEAIKIITEQYIPLDNTLIFDGVRSVTERWKIAE